MECDRRTPAERVEAEGWELRTNREDDLTYFTVYRAPRPGEGDLRKTFAASDLALNQETDERIGDRLVAFIRKTEAQIKSGEGLAAWREESPAAPPLRE